MMALFMSVFVLQGPETMARLTSGETMERKAPGNNPGRQAVTRIGELMF